MKCPMCGKEKISTIDTRHEDDCVVRRKQCLNEKCKYRWSTIEIDTNQWYSALQIKEQRKRGRKKDG